MTNPFENSTNLKPSEKLAAIEFAETLDPKTLPTPTSPELMVAVAPAIEEFKAAAALSVRELVRRLTFEANKLETSVLLATAEKMAKLSLLLEGKPTDRIDITASEMVRKLMEEKEIEPNIYNLNDCQSSDQK